MENYIVSARKYRPETFDTVVGQEAITTTLKNAIKSGQLAQAFLFCGPRGVGKTTCARILARTINCFNPTENMEACGVCESCESFKNNASYNIHELDAASNNSVENIRSLIEQVRVPPQVGKYKIYIIDEVHMLSTAAFNAFLKTLEEPPTYANLFWQRPKNIRFYQRFCRVVRFLISSESRLKTLRITWRKLPKKKAFLHSPMRCTSSLKRPMVACVTHFRCLISW